MKYRAEIDGLRALAVIPVVFFHAGFHLFKGGFVGVDIFFVISGYLITTIIIEQIESNQFNILSFYERRARRILPALYLVMFVCILFSWIWMLPNQMKDFSQSLVAISLFASNFLFWFESGYFDVLSEEKPLLHTWSLAVEEQYYIFFPIFLILVWRYGKNKVFWLIFLLCVSSFILSEWAWRNKATTANFFLMPSRMWEILIGSITAFIVQKNGVQKNNILAIIGLGAILISIFIYDSSTPFPSVYTLLPVFGVALIILYANKETLVAKILSLNFFVSLGLISYSTYLWHQPIFAFARIRLLDDPSKKLMISLIFLSIILAYLSWKYVEKPFRNNDKISRANIIGLSTFGFILFITFGLYGHFQDGIPNRLSQEVKGRFNYIEALGKERMELIKSGQCHYNDRDITFNSPKLRKFLDQWECNNGNKSKYKIAVFGDSHAADKAVSLILNDFNITRLGGAGCNLNPSGFQKFSYCSSLIKRMEKEILENSYDIIIIANSFDDPLELNPNYINEILSYWSALSNKVIFFSPMIEFKNFKNSYILSGKSKFKLNDDSSRDFFKILESINVPENVTILNTKEIFCGITNGDCLPIQNGKVFLTDDSHLSSTGAYEFGLQFKNILN